MKKNSFVSVAAFVVAFACGSASAMLGIPAEALGGAAYKTNAAFVAALVTKGLKAGGGTAALMVDNKSKASAIVKNYVERQDAGKLVAGDVAAFLGAISAESAAYNGMVAAVVQTLAPMFTTVLKVVTDNGGAPKWLKVGVATLQEMDALVTLINADPRRWAPILMAAAVQGGAAGDSPAD